jgi:hypothetical protein
MILQLERESIFCSLSLETTLVGDLFNNWLRKMPSAPSLFSSDNTKRPNSPETCSPGNPKPLRSTSISGRSLILIHQQKNGMLSQVLTTFWWAAHQMTLRCMARYL